MGSMCKSRVSSSDVNVFYMRKPHLAQACSDPHAIRAEWLSTWLHTEAPSVSHQVSVGSGSTTSWLWEPGQLI